MSKYEMAMDLKDAFEDIGMRTELEKAETVAAAAVIIQRRLPEITAADLARFIDRQLAMKNSETDEMSVQVGDIAGVNDFFHWLSHKAGKWARDFRNKD